MSESLYENDKERKFHAGVPRIIVDTEQDREFSWAVGREGARPEQGLCPVCGGELEWWGRDIDETVMYRGTCMDCGRSVREYYTIEFVEQIVVEEKDRKEHGYENA